MHRRTGLVVVVAEEGEEDSVVDAVGEKARRRADRVAVEVDVATESEREGGAKAVVDGGGRRRADRSGAEAGAPSMGGREDGVIATVEGARRRAHRVGPNASVEYGREGGTTAVFDGDVRRRAERSGAEAGAVPVDRREDDIAVIAEKRTSRRAGKAGNAAAGGREDDAADVVDGDGKALRQTDQIGAETGAVDRGGREEDVLANKSRPRKSMSRSSST